MQKAFEELMEVFDKKDLSLKENKELTQHPNYKMTSDADPKNALDIEKYLSHREKIHPDDQFVLVDVDSLPPA